MRVTDTFNDDIFTTLGDSKQNPATLGVRKRTDGFPQATGQLIARSLDLPVQHFLALQPFQQRSKEGRGCCIDNDTSNVNC